MKKFLETLKAEVMLCDGAMGTQLIARGLSPSLCKEEQNIVNPSLVLSIHEDYIRAGSQIIETNTFAANYFQLKKFGLENKVKEINKQGAILAKSAGSRKNVFVAGSVGPIGALIKPYGPLTQGDVKRAYEEQIGYLIEGGVDLIIIETISNLIEAKEAIEAARNLSMDMPVICQLTFMADGNTKFGNDVVSSLLELKQVGADIVGMNCTLGPRESYDIFTNMTSKIPAFLSVQPNAGYPSIQAGKPVYYASPEYMKKYAKLFVEAGANIVGACCGSAPEHIQAMAEAVVGIRPKPKMAKLGLKHEIKLKEEPIQIQKIEKPRNLREYIKKDFILTVEIDPPKGCDYEELLSESLQLKESGIDLINVADNPMARVRMSSLAMAFLVKEKIKLEPILHFTCRDRNILGIQSELLGAAALGINVILALRGDPATIGDFPKATSVFDVDSHGLVKIINSLNKGYNFAGAPINAKTNFIIGVAGNPSTSNLDNDLNRLKEKISEGAQFIQTQPVYDIKKLQLFSNAIKELNVELIIGILPLLSYKQAMYLNNEVPGITIPEEILSKFEKIDNPIKAEDEGIKITLELMNEAKKYVNGFYFIPPPKKLYVVKEIIKSYFK